MSARKDWAVAFWARKLLIVAGSTPVIPLVAEATVWACSTPHQRRSWSVRDDRQLPSCVPQQHGVNRRLLASESAGVEVARLRRCNLRGLALIAGLSPGKLWRWAAKSRGPIGDSTGGRSNLKAADHGRPAARVTRSRGTAPQGGQVRGIAAGTLVVATAVEGCACSVGRYRRASSVALSWH